MHSPSAKHVIPLPCCVLQIFQRMTTYAKYTIAMTFRICFTFGLLTVIYNWWAGLGWCTPFPGW